MKVEIIAVGTELLMGQVVNTNATFLSDELTGLGYSVFYQTVVGDNTKRLTDCLTIATRRSELIILTGGLGPTDDDLTRETLADFLKEPLLIDEAGLAKIHRHFENQKRTATANNLKQALTISGGETIQNPNGLAVGDFYQKAGKTYLLLPGPPNELIPMFRQYALPLLKEKLPQEKQLYSKVIRFFGIGESQLVTLLADEIEQQINPTIAPYAAPNEVRLRLTAQATSEKEATELLVSLEKRINEVAGEYIYGYGEENSLVEETVKLLKEQKQTLAVAESLTAGLVQSNLGKLAGVSEVFLGGFVTYSNEMKQTLLGVSPETLLNDGAISEQCAKEMALNTKQKTGANYSLAFTGVAGPSESEGKPVGTTWISLAKPNGEIQTEEFHFNRNREYIQHGAMMAGLNMLRLALLKNR